MTRKQLLIAVLLSGVALPGLAADSYTVDPMHTYPSLEFSHMGMSIWRGKFNKSSGRIVLDRVAKTGTVDVTIDVASISFGLAAMDEKARSDDFFNVEKFPTATYKGSIRFAGEKPKSVEGSITLMGVTRPANLKINLFNCMPHPMLKREFCGADAEGDMNWGEYGMKMSQYGQGDAGMVHLRIQVEALRDE
ncbi:MAG TPA: YceI family protein [Burkholderiales bacterium]|nr:YceI family protein [Burkholderiales bacterium]